VSEARAFLAYLALLAVSMAVGALAEAIAAPRVLDQPEARQ